MASGTGDTDSALLGVPISAKTKPLSSSNGAKTSALPDPETVTVQELREVIRGTMPARGSARGAGDRRQPAAVSVGGAATPWTIVGGPAIPEHMNAFDEVYPNQRVRTRLIGSE